MSLGRSNPKLRRHAESARKPATSAASAVPRKEKMASMPNANAEGPIAVPSALAVAVDRSIEPYTSSSHKYVKNVRRGVDTGVRFPLEVRTEPIFFFPLGTEDRERADEDDALIARCAEETRDDATARTDVGTDTAATIPDDMARTGVMRRGVCEERVEMAKVIHFLFRLS